MIKKGFTARIPDDLATFFQYLAESKKWTVATTMREIVKTSPYYLEYLKKIGVS